MVGHARQNRPGPSALSNDSFESVAAHRFTRLMKALAILLVAALAKPRLPLYIGRSDSGATMTDTIDIASRGDFGLWAIEVAKQIVSEQGFELARAAKDGAEEDIRVAGNALGQAITNALMEVYDGLLEGPVER
jgi:hypothetical protein